MVVQQHKEEEEARTRRRTNEVVCFKAISLARSQNTAMERVQDDKHWGRGGCRPCYEQSNCPSKVPWLTCVGKLDGMVLKHMVDSVTPSSSFAKVMRPRPHTGTYSDSIIFSLPVHTQTASSPSHTPKNIPPKPNIKNLSLLPIPATQYRHQAPPPIDLRSHDHLHTPIPQLFDFLSRLPLRIGRTQRQDPLVDQKPSRWLPAVNLFLAAAGVQEDRHVRFDVAVRPAECVVNSSE